MLTMTETQRSLSGALLVLRGRREGLALLDRSIDGFWRSFAAILLLVPIDAVATLAAVKTNTADGPFAAAFLGSLPLLALQWVAFPVVLALLARPLAVTRTFVSYVVARNWTSPIMAVAVTLPLLLQGAGWIPPDGTAFILMVTLVLVLWLHIRIVRIALDVGLQMAVALVALDVVVTIALVLLFA